MVLSVVYNETIVRECSVFVTEIISTLSVFKNNIPEPLRITDWTF